MSGEDKTVELRQKKRQARQSGGPERIAARDRAGTQSARERVERLLDPDTFVELDVLVVGAVTGHGKVMGRDMYVFAQDGERSPDTSDEALARKLAKIGDLAVTNGAPLLGIYDCGPKGTVRSLGGYAGLSSHNVLASGVVPQIALVMGSVAGAAALSCLLSDLVIMVKGTSQLLLGGEEAGEGSESLGGARVLSEKSGVAHLATDDEGACLEAVRKLLGYLPQNNLEDPPLDEPSDPADRMEAGLDALAGDGKAEDVREVVRLVLDAGSFMELQPEWSKNLVTGFARLGGRSVGVVANQATEAEGRLDADAAVKGARFVRLCDAFNLPVITFVDTPGFVSGEAHSAGRALREAAKLTYAYSEATVPKLSVVIGRALAEGFEVMGPKHLRADFCFAWPAARMTTPSAAEESERESPYVAAQAGYLDDIIEPSTSRPRLVAALEASISKREARPPKKHGNIPL